MSYVKKLSSRMTAITCMVSMLVVSTLTQAAPLPAPGPDGNEIGVVNANCPECEIEVAALRELEKEFEDIKNLIQWKYAELDGIKAWIKEQKRKVELADMASHSQDGTGGSAFDPATGLTTESITLNDGRVRITTYDASGKIVSGPEFRLRKDVEQLKKELKAEKDKLADLEKKQKKTEEELKKS